MLKSICCSLVAVVLVFASCTKEANIHLETQIEQLISDRSSTTEVQASVESSEESDGALTVEFSGISAEAHPSTNQTLIFDISEGTVAYNFFVTDFQNIGDNLLIDFDAVGVDLEGLDIQAVQLIIIDEGMVE